MPAQSGAGPQSGVPDEGNQAPEVNVSDNDQRCDLTNLQPAIDSQQEAGGTTYVEIGFTNEGPSCWIDGFPQIIFSGGGSVISTAVRDGDVLRTGGLVIRVLATPVMINERFVESVTADGVPALLAELAETPVHLFLFVKVDERWQDKREHYQDVGLDFDA